MKFNILILIIIGVIYVYSADWSGISFVTGDDISDFQPVCKFDLNGRPHVVFRSGYAINGISEIYYANFNFIKKIWEFTHQPISPSGIWAYNPDIALLNSQSDLNFYDVTPVVVWARTNSDYSQSIIEYTYLNNGSWVTPKIISSPVKVNSDPEIVVTFAKGSMYLFVFWVGAEAINSQTDLYYAYIDVKNIGTGFSNTKRIEVTDTTMHDSRPSLSVDSKGSVWLSWEVGNENQQQAVAVKVARFDWNSSSWINMSPGNKYLDIQSFEPSISTYQFSNSDSPPVFVAWRKNENSQTNIYSSIWTKDNNWSTPFSKVNSSDMTNNNLPSGAFISENIIGCCWRNIDSNNEHEIWYNWCNSNDNKWDEVNIVNISGRSNLKDDYPNVSSDGYGDFMCVWMGERTTIKDRYDVLSRFYDTEPPRILKVEPKKDKTDVNPNEHISMFFIENIDKYSINMDNIIVKGQYSGVHTWQSNIHEDVSSSGLLIVELNMNEKFNLSERVDVIVKNLKDEYGNIMEREFTWSFTTSSTEVFIDDKVYLWPNPSNGNTVNMWMNLYHPATLTFDIYDLSGKKVRVTSFHQEPNTDLSVSVDISNLGSDVYIVIMNAKSDLTGETKQFAKKLAVVR